MPILKANLINLYGLINYTYSLLYLLSKLYKLFLKVYMDILESLKSCLILSS